MKKSEQGESRGKLGFMRDERKMEERAIVGERGRIMKVKKCFCTRF